MIDKKSLLMTVLSATGILAASACSRNDDSGATANTTVAPAFAAAPASNAGPVEAVSVSKEAVFEMSAADLWKKVGDFNGVHTWHPAVAKSEIVKGNNNEVGAHRKLTLGDGEVIVEELATRDEAGMSLSYTIVDAPLPVSDYLATMNVKAQGDGRSKLTWASKFKPLAGAETAEVQKIIGDIYQAGLDSLAKPASSG